MIRKRLYKQTRPPSFFNWRENSRKSTLFTYKRKLRFASRPFWIRKNHSGRGGKLS
ncbi:Bgt-5223 [Blumeria graminis f. sp. tritici]|uniref:Bgt-5223 n=1 Tax=Blumeria graminis f. sp. tritici TaxID=62690 RepID=A0A9X9L981_BLUGR|nr:Bgt-5223 [Blumeria graminis f. sp. tritici]